MEQHKLIIRIAMIVALVGSSVGFYFWYQYHQAWSSDVTTLTSLTEIQSGLSSYYRDHSAYPSAGPDGSRIIGYGGLGCLTGDGFRAECPKKDVYDKIPAGPFEYRGLEAGGAPCTSPAGCPRYEILFELSTSAAYSKGGHILMPEGVK